jgi:AcrR family transcriptional regulator
LTSLENERTFLGVTASSAERPEPVERADQVRQAIIGAALDAFSASGFHGSTMRGIATIAGVVVSNMYHYFESKSAILLAVLEGASNTQYDLTRAAVLAAGSDVRDQLQEAVKAFVKYDLHNPREAFIANSELRYLDPSQRARIIAARDKQQEMFERLVTKGSRDGLFTTPYPDQACLAILTMCAGVTVWHRSSGPLTVDQIAEQYARYALGLLEVRW